MRFHPRIAHVVKRRFGKLSRGVTAVEYALLLFLISIVMVPALIVLGPSIGATFQKVTDGIGGKASSDPTADPTADPTTPGTGNNVPCVDGDNSNGYYNNRFWSTGTDYGMPDSGWAGDVVEGPSGQVWVGRDGYTDLSVADVLANGTAATTPWADYPFWSKTNNIATTASNPPDGIDPMYFQCLYGNDTPLPTDPKVCLDGYNGNTYFDNRYWSTGTNYYTPSDMGSPFWIGTVVQTSDGPKWSGQQYYTGMSLDEVTSDTWYVTNPDFTDYPFWSPTNEFGGVLKTDASSVDVKYLTCGDYLAPPAPNTMDEYNPTSASVSTYREGPTGGYCTKYVGNNNDSVPDTTAYLVKEFYNGTEYLGPNGAVYKDSNGNVTAWANQDVSVQNMYWQQVPVSDYGSPYPAGWSQVPADSYDFQTTWNIDTCASMPARPAVGYYKQYTYISIYDHEPQTYYESLWIHQSPVGTVDAPKNLWAQATLSADPGPTAAFDQSGAWMYDSGYWAPNGYYWVRIDGVQGTYEAPQYDQYIWNGTSWVPGGIPIMLYSSADVTSSGVTDIHVGQNS